MSRAGNKPARLVRKWIVFCHNKIPKRAVAYVHGITVHIKLRAGCGVLKIVLALVFCHPCAFVVRVPGKIDSGAIPQILRAVEPSVLMA